MTEPNILKALLSLQEREGAITPAAIGGIAHQLGTTTAQVAGVLSYYPDLRDAPPGRRDPPMYGGVLLCQRLQPALAVGAGSAARGCRRNHRRGSSRWRLCPAPAIARWPRR
ncbi:MAG: NAD(P)H-dependent oxidoreductase subunit E [Candidatus Parvibacillus calidus]|nr:MAG: NAD(P)H-dependent oxidoreductase subunit E [Candidatus Parvibacillus calidus]